MPVPGIRLAAARHALNLLGQQGALQLADCAVDHEVITPTVADLWLTRDPSSSWAVKFERMLRELGVELPPPAEAARALLRHHLHSILEGTANELRALESLFHHMTDCAPVTNLARASVGPLEWCYFRLTSDPEPSTHDKEKALAQARELATAWDRVHGPPLASSWLFANGAVVLALARAIRADRDFGRLPVLADALEEAGCAGPDVLEHCRFATEHPNDCWVVDRILWLA